MTPYLLFIIFVFIAGILFVCSQLQSKQKTREEFLKQFEEFVGSSFQPIEDQENCFRIVFNFDGEEFVFEDIEKHGFKGNTYKARLKVAMPGKFNMSFIERTADAVKHSSILESTGLDSKIYKQQLHFKMPKELSLFDVVTNNMKLAQEILNDDKIVRIFSEFKNIKGPGYPFVSFRIEDSELILDFYPFEAPFLPNLRFLYSDVASIEDYCQKMLIIVKRLKWKLEE